MQGANKTINTKVGLDLPMSEQVRQRQVTLNEGKTFVNTKWVYGSKFGNETHFLSFAAIVATRNGTEGSTFPCGVAQCKTCKFIDSSTVISASKSTYNIQHNFTCTSTHLIYCISCSRCGMLYIGETGRQLRTRFGEHRRAVSANDANQPVARHFNSGSHCISDMKIRALCPISGSKDSRKRQEMRLISKLGTVHPLGINERFSFI